MKRITKLQICKNLGFGSGLKYNIFAEDIAKLNSYKVLYDIYKTFNFGNKFLHTELCFDKNKYNNEEHNGYMLVCCGDKQYKLKTYKSKLEIRIYKNMLEQNCFKIFISKNEQCLESKYMSKEKAKKFLHRHARINENNWYANSYCFGLDNVETINNFTTFNTNSFQSNLLK